MPKVFQVLNGFCYWLTPYSSVDETIGRYPPDCLFVEAPDYVREGWGYLEENDGVPLEGDDRFIKPTAPEGFIYDDETGTFFPESELPVILENEKNDKQNENKMRFAEYLATHPLTWVDGKVYGVTLEDQSEIALNLQQYQIQVQAGVENPILEWHAMKEPCAPWTLENLSALAMAISAHVYPWFQKMNEYKGEIFACETREEVAAINLDYSDPSDENEEENPVEETTEEVVE